MTMQLYSFRILPIQRRKWPLKYKIKPVKVVVRAEHQFKVKSIPSNTGVALQWFQCKFLLLEALIKDVIN